MRLESAPSPAPAPAPRRSRRTNPLVPAFLATLVLILLGSLPLNAAEPFVRTVLPVVNNFPSQVFLGPMKADEDGSLYVSGYCLGQARFSPTLTVGAPDHNITTIFVARLNAEGAWVWASAAVTIQSKPLVQIRDLAVSDNHIVVVGETKTTSNADPSGFVGRLLKNGTGALNSTIAGVSNGQYAGVSAVDIDGTGNIYIGGRFRGSARIGSLTVNGIPPANADPIDQDIYVIKLDASLVPSWAARAGSSLGAIGASRIRANGTQEDVVGLRADAAGNIYVAFNGAGYQLYMTGTTTPVLSRPIMLMSAGRNDAAYSFYTGAHISLGFNGALMGVVGVLSPQGAWTRATAQTTAAFYDRPGQPEFETPRNVPLTHMALADGKLFVAGQYQPFTSTVFQAFATRLGADSLLPDGPTLYLKNLAGSPTLASRLSANGGKVFLTGIMGPSLKAYQLTSSETELGDVDREITSVQTNLFVLGTDTDLNPLWARTTTRPNDQLRPSSFTATDVAYDSLRQVVYWGGSFHDPQRKLWLGEEGNPTALGPTAGPTGWLTAFTDSGSYREQVLLMVQSDFGQITINGALHPGTQAEVTLLRDTPVTVSVPPLVPGLTAPDDTRHRCTGFRINGNILSGSAATFSLKLNDDLNAQFSWVTEHRLTITSDHDDAGMGSHAAAGLADPPIGVSWIRNGEIVNGFIDGLVLPIDGSSVGSRFVVTGYSATGAAGTNVVFDGIEARQQVGQFTMTGPAGIAYHWKKQHRIQISTTTEDSFALPAVRQLNNSGAVLSLRTGAGEFWFDQGARLQIAARASESTLGRALKGWRNADPIPQVFPTIQYIAPDDATNDAVQLALNLDPITIDTVSFWSRPVNSLQSPIRVTWDYGDLIVPLDTALGSAIVIPSQHGALPNAAPKAVRIVDAPPGSTPDDMLVWDAVARLAYPLRPGIYFVDWNTAAGGRLVTQIFAGFPGDPIPQRTPAAFFPGSSHYRHIADTPPEEIPPVDLDPDPQDASFFRGIKFRTGNATAINHRFAASEPGRSVLLFSLSPTAGIPAVGDTNSETVRVRVAETRRWDDSRAWQGGGSLLVTAPSATVGEPLASNLDTAGLGTGYLIHRVANYNASLYDRTTPRGPIIPVNRPLATPTGENRLIVVWYENRDGILWPYQPAAYDSFAWPLLPGATKGAPPFALNRIVIASRLGTDGLDANGQPQTSFDPLKFADVKVYQQGDTNQPGYNPNEEHARLYPSFLHASHAAVPPAVFALRNDLNISRALVDASPSDALGTNQYTSDPFVLVQYTDLTLGQPRMRVYQVLREDPNTQDNRLLDLPGTATPTYTFRYRMKAGEIVNAPYPLNLVLGLQPCVNTVPVPFSPPTARPNGSYFLNGQSRQKTWMVDHKGQAWAVSGDSHFTAHYQYPLADDFWYPFGLDADAAPAATGECLAFLPAFDPGTGQRGVFSAQISDRWTPAPIRFDTVWPDDAPVLKVGETLTYPGGENKADQPTAQGLPGVLGWASGEVVFDSFNPSLAPTGPPGHFQEFSARLIAPLEDRLVSLPTSALPSTLQAGSPEVRVEGDHWYFTSLPPSLQKRVFFRPLSKLRAVDAPGVLGLRGYVNDRTLGASDLTASPPPVYVLEPNILTPTDLDALLAIGGTDADWQNAVDALYALSRNPRGLDENGDNLPDPAWLAGLEPQTVWNSDGTPGGLNPRGAAPLRALGPGLALVTNPRLLDPANVLPSGYVTLAENNHPSLGAAPITLHVIRIDRSRIYRGAIKTILPPNVFDEKITLRHTADFGGNVDEIAFNWWYHEEDGTVRSGDVPPGTPPKPVWSSFGSALGASGLSQINLDANPTLLLADNLFFVRYRHVTANPGNPAHWSDWAGAANSSPRDLDDNGVPDYRAQLASGWVKRVLDAVNPYEARIRDFSRNDAPATGASLLQQLGAPYVGPVALNAEANVIQNVGLIELYETVLRRARALSIDASLPTATPGIHAAILLASSRLADFYGLLAAEASSDATDPTIGVGSSAVESASLGSSRFCFENQLPSLLEEELSLLRGRDESLGRPVYNRLFWNFTKGEGEVAYALNYRITDVTGDGFIDENDALRLYPQGHGDAWGHYLSAMRKRYDLLRHPLFRWDARSEFYNLLDVVLGVDFSDERKFAQTAADRAQVGAEIVAQTYRSRYLENPDSQWQGYFDANPSRAWGVTEWARRAGQAALFDWITANSLVPAEDPDPTHTGIQRIDRKGLGDIARISTQLGTIQTTLDASNSGLNPIGLDPNVVPFDLDPTHIDVGSTAQIGRQAVQGLSHFEQIFERAFTALKNAREALDHANAQKARLDRIADSAEQRRVDAAAKDLEFRNRLIEIFGTPYEGTIGGGKPYPAGYQGPDLNLFMYVDVNAVDDGTVPAAAPDYFEAFVNFHSLTNDLPEQFRANATANYLRYEGSVEITAEGNMTAEFVDGSILRLTLPTTAADYTFVAPADWGQRAAPGRLQLLVGDMVQTQARLALAVGNYDFLHKQIRDRIESMLARANMEDAALTLRMKNFKVIVGLKSVIAALDIARETSDQLADDVQELTEDLGESLPQVVGMASDVTFPARYVIKSAGNVASTLASIFAIGQSAVSAAHELTSYSLEQLQDLTIDKAGFDAEIVGLLGEIEELLVSEGTTRISAFEIQEQLRSQLDQYRATLQEGVRLLEERRQANARFAAATQDERYHDAFLRSARNEASVRYRSLFDLASRYAYLAAKAYDYETNFDLDDRASAIPLLNEIVRERSLGEVGDSQPLHLGGLAGILARLQDNFRAVEGRLGFNNLQLDHTSFSLRYEAFRTDQPADWTNRLHQARVADLNALPEFRRFCRPFSAANVAQPGLVFRFPTRIQAGRNFFNRPLGAGDSAYDPTLYATKIRAAGLRFIDYPVGALARTPYVYLVPAGLDTMIIPDSPVLKTRSWNVVDQAIPAPFNIGASDLGRPNWIASLDSLSGSLTAIRRFSSFRAGVVDDDPDVNVTRFIGRSVWNSDWILIIPGQTLLDQPNTGLDRLIENITDIQLTFETYGYSGN